MQDNWTDGDAYELYVGRWSRRVGELFLGWLGAPEGLRWLDLGCGTGALTDEILGRCRPRSVVGVEPSEGFLAVARQKAQMPGVEFRQGSAERIPLEDRSVDAAVSGLVLNFVPDKAATMRELVRVVRSGGTVAAYVWDYAGHVQFMRRFWDAAVALDPAARDKDEGVRFPVCRPAPLRELFAAAGFAEVSVAALDIATPFKDFDDYWAPFLKGIGPAPGYCASLGESARSALRERLRQTLPTDPDGRILLAARAWAVRGRVPSSAAGRA
jgi:SAM-dependent methyltransferase